MENPRLFVCPQCFQEDSGHPEHEHQVLECQPGMDGSFRRSPLSTADGLLLSRAPLWYLEASGWLKAVAPFTLWQR